MFRIAVLLAVFSLLIVGGPGGFAAQAQSPLPPSAVATDADSFGLPPVTYDEIVGRPTASAGYSFAAIAVGAVVGVMAAEIVLPVLGYAVVPAALAGTPVTGAMLEAALATSRLVAVSAAVAGGAVGQWLYSGWGR